MANEKTPSNEKTTKMNIALTPEDKLFLKIYAAELDTSVAQVIHRWIEREREEQSKKDSAIEK